MSRIQASEQCIGFDREVSHDKPKWTMQDRRMLASYAKNWSRGEEPYSGHGEASISEPFLRELFRRRLGPEVAEILQDLLR